MNGWVFLSGAFSLRRVINGFGWSIDENKTWKKSVFRWFSGFIKNFLFARKIVTVLRIENVQAFDNIQFAGINKFFLSKNVFFIQMEKRKRTK